MFSQEGTYLIKDSLSSGTYYRAWDHTAAAAQCWEYAEQVVSSPLVWVPFGELRKACSFYKRRAHSIVAEQFSSYPDIDWGKQKQMCFPTDVESQNE